MQHENIARHEELEVGSDRSFGLVFAGVFLLVGLWPQFKQGEVRVWALAVTAAFAVITLVCPAWLHRPNVLWARFGLLLGKVMAPAALGLLFFGVFTPMGQLMRLFNVKLLSSSAKADSYWIERKDGQPTPESLRNQF